MAAGREQKREITHDEGRTSRHSTKVNSRLYTVYLTARTLGSGEGVCPRRRTVVFEANFLD